MQHYVLKMVGQPDIIATKTGVFSVKHVAYIMERRKIMISFILCLLLNTGRDRNYQGRDPDDIAGVKK